MRISRAERNHQITLDIDEQCRSDAAAERLSKLASIIGCKDITAENIPGLNDDATAIQLLTRVRANHHGVSLKTAFPSYFSVERF